MNDKMLSASTDVVPGARNVPRNGSYRTAPPSSKQFTTASVTCNAGALMGGGASASTGNVIKLSAPLTGASLSTDGQTPDGWIAAVDAGNVSVYAICSGL